ncbi:unnamed protein product [Rhizopus stolonifer]
MATAKNLGTQDWVQKIHFENKVDINLQAYVKNESTKIEVEEIPNSNTSQDDYLQSILSSKSSPSSSLPADKQCTGLTATCTCYKCQRQRRRAGHRMENNDSKLQTTEPTLITQKEEINEPLPRVANKPNVIESHRSSTLRKTPSLIAYEKQIPKPVYLQQDSIYRMEKPCKDDSEKVKSPTSIVDTTDKYEISWKEDGTGDDLLSPLVTFQTIFDTTDKNDGLSDLLEQKAKELKSQRFKVEEEPKEILPPRLSECLTLSYRKGPQHNPLTLYHTMKMNTGKERTHAYGLAFGHCVQSDSGLSDWMKRPRSPVPIKEHSTWVQTIPQKPKRSLLSTFKKSSKSLYPPTEDIFWTSTDTLGRKSTDTIDIQPTNVVSASHALLPNHPTTAKNTREHVDPVRARCITDSKDTTHVLESNTTRLVNKSSRLFSSLGRKPSVKSFSNEKSPSLKSLEKVKESQEQ